MFLSAPLPPPQHSKKNNNLCTYWLQFLTLAHTLTLHELPHTIRKKMHTPTIEYIINIRCRLQTNNLSISNIINKRLNHKGSSASSDPHFSTSSWNALCSYLLNCADFSGGFGCGFCYWTGTCGDGVSREILIESSSCVLVTWSEIGVCDALWI